MVDEVFDARLFRQELDELMRRNRDPALHEVIWTYIEGAIDRRTLRRDGVYTAALAEFYRERFDELERAGVDFKAVRADVRRLVEAEDAAHGTDLASTICTSEGE